MNKTEYTTFLLRNIPRSIWNKVKIKCINKNLKMNELMLNLVKRYSEGKIDVSE